MITLIFGRLATREPLSDSERLLADIVKQVLALSNESARLQAQIAIR